MATSTITNTIKDPTGAVLAGVPVDIWLVASPGYTPTSGFRVSDGVEVAPYYRTTTGVLGVWSATLERNTNILPASTNYVAIERLTPAQGKPRTWSFVVGASDQTLQAALLVQPNPQTLPAVPASFFAQGLLAQRSAAGHAGFLYYATDTAQWFRDDGTVWHEVLMADSSTLGLTSVKDARFATIQDACNAAITGTVEFPEGTYPVTTTIIRPPQQNWRGRAAGGTSPGNSMLQWGLSAGAHPMVTTIPGGFSTDAAAIEKLRFDGQDVATYCFQGQDITYLALRDVFMKGALTAALYLNNVEGFKIENSLFERTQTGGNIVKMLGSSPGTFDTCAFIIVSGGGNGIDATGSASTVFLNCDYEGSGLGNVGLILDGTQSARVIGGYWEQWLGACIAANNTAVSNLVIDGGNYDATDAAAACINLNVAGHGHISIRSPWFPTLGDVGSSSVGILLPSSITDVEITGARQPSGNTGTLIKIGSTTYPYGTLIIRPQLPTNWFGHGAPANNVSATYSVQPKIGDTYTRDDPGAAGNRIYICTTGGASPVWTATAA